jgi:hypothetical protein
VVVRPWQPAAATRVAVVAVCYGGDERPGRGAREPGVGGGAGGGGCWTSRHLRWENGGGHGASTGIHGCSCYTS